MNWFKRILGSGSEGRGKRDERRNRPSSIVHRPSPRSPRGFDAVLFLFLALFTGLFLLKTDLLHSVPVSFSSGGAQVNWATATPGVTAVRCS